MTHISGKNGGVYTSALLVENCEDTWNEQVVAGVALSAETGKVGTYCARATTTGVGATTVLMSEAITKDLSGYDALYWWARSSIQTAAGDLQILLDEDANCASPSESLNLPALTAATWQQCFSTFAGTTAARDTLISVGLYQVTDLANATFDVDDVEALAEVDGIKSWTLDYTADALETTDFADAGVKSYIIGGTGWAGSFEGFKDGAPLGIGSEVYLLLGESNTDGQGYIGKAFITAAHPVSSADGIVSYSYDFTGTGDLDPATA